MTQVSILIDQKTVDLENLYLSTQDGFMFPPNMPVQNLFNINDTEKNAGMWHSVEIIALKIILKNENDKNVGLFGQNIKALVGTKRIRESKNGNMIPNKVHKKD